MSLPAFYLVCAGPHTVFRSPNCGTQMDIDYQRIFHSSICSEVSYKLVTSLTNTRRSMASRLSAPDTSIQEKLDSVNQYLPHILTLFHSLKNQAPVRLDAGMMFEWRGSFSVNGAPYKFPEIIYEVAMTLHAKAMLHYNLGCYLLSLDLNSNLSPAGQHFLTAAGIMEYLASHLLPQWLSQSQIIKPPETNTTICRAMADLFQGEAQQLAVVKAMQKPGGTSNAIITKLCVAVLRIFDQGMDALQIASDIKTTIDAHIPYFNRTFYAALSYYYNAEFYRLKEEPEPQTGIALGLFRESRTRINDLSLVDTKTKTSILQNLSAKNPLLRDGVQYLLNNIMQSNAVAEKDNRLIFFQSIPGNNECPPLPFGALVMIRKLYHVAEDEEIVTFTFDPDRSKIPLGTIWTPPLPSPPPSQPSQPLLPSAPLLSSDADNSKVGVTGAASASDAAKIAAAELADHEMAMELQKKINLGEV